MSDWIENGEQSYLWRTKMNNLNGMLRINITSDVITAGAITSIPIVDLGSPYDYILQSGDVIYIEDIETGDLYPVTLNAYSAACPLPHLSCNSWTLPKDLIAGCSIYFSVKDILKIIRSGA